MPENSIPVHRTIYRCDACRCGLLSCVCDIHANTLVDGARFRFADDDLFNLTILAEVIIPTERLQQSIFVFYRRNQSNNVDKVLLFDSDTSQVASVGGFNFTLLGLFSLGRSLLLILVLLVKLEFLRCWYFVLYCFLIIDSTAIWTGTLLVGSFETVEAKLAYLSGIWSANGAKTEVKMRTRVEGLLAGCTHLITTRARFEVFV